jgi:transcriptional regulator with XRE-family HTH domain
MKPKEGTAEFIGARMYEERVVRKLTREDVAAALGVKQQQVAKYEDGRNRVSAPTLWRYAIWLKVKPGIFFQPRR